ncbi:MAG: hypothetical protein IH593_09550 [Bacteroidales bacterium]|nr:hypothetical protein [Bacteroidales bacterium]
MTPIPTLSEWGKSGLS